MKVLRLIEDGAQVVHDGKDDVEVALDRVASVQRRYFEIHNDSWAGWFKGALRSLGILRRAPLDQYALELEAMHTELASALDLLTAEPARLAAIFGSSEAAAGVCNLVVHLDHCVVWLHQIAQSYSSGERYPEEVAAAEHLELDKARTRFHAHAAEMDIVLRAARERHEENAAEMDIVLRAVREHHEENRTSTKGST